MVVVFAHTFLTWLARVAREGCCAHHGGCGAAGSAVGGQRYGRGPGPCLAVLSSDAVGAAVLCLCPPASAPPAASGPCGLPVTWPTRHEGAGVTN